MARLVIVTYTDDRDVARFRGQKYRLDKQTGYYLCSKGRKRKRLHRDVWEYFNGSIPRGTHVHHADFDKSNNQPSNLRLENEWNHLSAHARKRKMEDPDWFVRFQSAGIEAAKGWHASKEGRE